jgi:membrane protein
MDWLTRLPVVGPVVAWMQRTRPYRVFEHFNDVHGNRMAAAVTFFGFLALFPLLTVAAAIGAAVLTDAQVHHIQEQLAEQLPGIARSLDLNSLVQHAGTVGVVSGLVLLYSGVGWVSTLRESVREVWDLPEDPGNPVVRKVLDVAVLVGLGVVCLVSLAASSVGSALAGWLAHEAGLSRTGTGEKLLAVAGFVVAVGADMLIFAYLLVGLPRLQEELRTEQRRGLVLQGALIGAFGFEVLKLALSSYISGVAGRSMYGAFGVPVALLLWINFICRLFFFCAAWTATPRIPAGDR